LQDLTPITISNLKTLRPLSWRRGAAECTKFGDWVGRFRRCLLQAVELLNR
jgi:hypothetical protein